MVDKKMISESFTAKSKSSGRIVNFGSKQSRDAAIKSGEYEEDKGDTTTPTKQTPPVNIFDKPQSKPKPTTKPQTPTDTEWMKGKDGWEIIDDERAKVKNVREYTDEELVGETGEYFENERTKNVAPNAFKDEAEMIEKIKSAPTEYLSSEQLQNMNNTDVGEILSASEDGGRDGMISRGKELAGEYGKDWDRLEKGIQKGNDVPPPIVLKDKSGNLHLLAGNTRLMSFTAYGKKLPVKVVEYDGEFNLDDESGVDTSKYTLKNVKRKLSGWAEKEKEFFKKEIHKAGSPERRSWKEAIVDKAKGAIAAIKKGAKHEVEEFKTAGEAVKGFFSGKELDENQKKALKGVATKIATTALFGAATGGLAGGLVGFGKHVALEFIPHIVGETILSGAGKAALFAGDEDVDTYMERFIKIVADKIENQKITAELMDKMIDSYNAKKEMGMNEYHTKTPHERVTAFNDRIKKAADKLKDAETPQQKKMLQNKIKLAKLGLQNYKQQQALKAKAERERKAKEMKKEEVTQITGDQREMVNGIIDILLQVKDLDNRMEMAKQQIQNFKDENINFNYAWFLSAAGLDNKDEPVSINTYSPTSTHISPVSVNSNMKSIQMKEAQQKLVYNSNPDAVELFLKKYPKVKQVMGVIASKNKDLLKGYKAFLKFKDTKEDYLGGRAEVTASPTFGSKTFYKYDFGGVKNHWPEVYQYVHFQQNEAINEIQYKDAVEKFNAELMKNSQVEKIAQFHKRSVKDVVKALQPYLKVLRYNDKSVKVISIDFRDTNSDIKVHASQTYKQNENWDSEMEPVEMVDEGIKKGSIVKKSINEEKWEAKNTKVYLNGKHVADYDFDSDSDSFWTKNLEGSGDKSFDTKEKLFAYLKKHGVGKKG